MAATLAIVPNVQIPPLEPGDHLTRSEFERRYAAMPQAKKAELIEGIVYLPSPVRLENHAQPRLLLNTWLGNYLIATPGIGGGDNATVRLDEDNESQPDALLRIPSHAGGRSKLEDDYVEGPPELAVEIAASSASYDLHVKKHAYRRNRIQEYLVWVIREARIDWWELREGEYVLLPKDADGIVKSRVFPGLWLAAEALLAGDLTAFQAAGREGIQSPEHAAFVERLARPPARESV